MQNTAHTFALWQPKQSFILGISGGADSVCLLDVFSTLAQKHDFQLHIAHVNYRLRGKDSDRDEALVKTVAAAYGIPCTILQPPKTSFAKSEESYRNLRYQFFESSMWPSSTDASRASRDADGGSASSADGSAE